MDETQSLADLATRGISGGPDMEIQIEARLNTAGFLVIDDGTAQWIVNALTREPVYGQRRTEVSRTQFLGDALIALVIPSQE